jgi:hypothetical protein
LNSFLLAKMIVGAWSNWESKKAVTVSWHCYRKGAKGDCIKFEFVLDPLFVKCAGVRIGYARRTMTCIFDNWPNLIIHFFSWRYSMNKTYFLLDIPKYQKLVAVEYQ